GILGVKNVGTPSPVGRPWCWNENRGPLTRPGGSGDSGGGRRNASLPALVAGRLLLALCTRPPGRVTFVRWRPERPPLGRVHPGVRARHRRSDTGCAFFRPPA